LLNEFCEFCEMGSEIIFRRAEEADIPLLMELAHRIWRAHYPAIITTEQIEYMLKNWYSAENLIQQMREGQITTLIIVNNRPLGYISIKEMEPGHFLLSKFYIDTTEHRQGIGSMTFQYALQDICKNYKSIRLQVNRRNIKAINFYFKNGFKIEQTCELDLGNGFVMDDFIMELRSN